MFDRNICSASHSGAAGPDVSQAYWAERRREPAGRHGRHMPVRSAFPGSPGLRLGSRLGAALGLLLLAAALVRQAEAGESAEAFVQRFADQSLAVLSYAELSDGDRRVVLRRLLVAHFDLAITGRFVLGRHWPRVTPEEQQEYLTLFEAFVAAKTLRRLEDYAGETIEIGRARPKGERGSLVPSRIRQPGGEAISVDWRLRQGAEGWRIIDIAVEGVSLAQTQRREFDAVIRGGHGRIGELLQRLRERTIALQASAG